MTTTTEFNEADLPELPSPEYEHVFPSGGYSRTQMDAYALAAVAASRKKLMQEPYCWGVESDGEIVDTFPTRNFAFEDAWRTQRNLAFSKCAYCSALRRTHAAGQ